MSENPPKNTENHESHSGETSDGQTEATPTPEESVESNPDMNGETEEKLKHVKSRLNENRPISAPNQKKVVSAEGGHHDSKLVKARKTGWGLFRYLFSDFWRGIQRLSKVAGGKGGGGSHSKEAHGGGHH